MATHSTILGWEISWTEEPGRLLSIGSQMSQTRFSDYTPPPPPILCPGVAWAIPTSRITLLKFQCEKSAL